MTAQNSAALRINKEQAFLYLNAAALILSLFVMLLGPLVRAEDAGLACPDWPLCKGKLIPDFDWKIFLEWTHRIAAAALSLVVIAWLSLSFSSASLRKQHMYAGSLACFLLLIQIILGALSVTQLLDATVVNLHLINAMLFLSVIAYSLHKSYYLYRHHGKAAAGRPALLYPASIFLTLCIFAQIFLGARVSTNNAGRVCNSFPACYYEAVIDKEKGMYFVPQYFPTMRGNLEKHMTHRFMAYFLLILVPSIFLLARKRSWPPLIRKLLGWTLVLIFFQAVIGALNVIYSLPTSLTVLHSFTAYCIYLTAFWMLLEARMEGLGKRKQ